MALNESAVEAFANDPGNAKVLHREETVLEVTEMICEAMAAQFVTQSELATRLSKSKSHVSQLLDGNANFTLKTLADILFVLNLRLSVSAVAVESCSVEVEWADGDYEHQYEVETEAFALFNESVFSRDGSYGLAS